MHLQDRKILVTGGASGLGLETVKRLAAAGAVVGVLDHSEAHCHTLTEACPGVVAVCGDVTVPEDVERGIEDIVARLGGLDGLVNCAGVLVSAPLIGVGREGIQAHPLDLWDSVIRTNLSSVFYVTRTAVGHMVRRRTRGVVVNVSSVSAAGNAGQSAYSAAKAGVNALTVTWAKELGPLGIRVVAVAPGFCDTASTHAALPESALKRVQSEIPLRRLGKAEEIADAIVFLLRNDFCNGKVFEVDGGLRV